MTPLENYAVAMSDIDAVKEDYPFTVKTISDNSPRLDIGDYLASENIEDWIVVTKYREGPVVNRGPTIVVFGFKNEQDAVAFKLRFGGR